MSVPKSKVLSSARNLSATKGVIALADVKVQSPSQSQIINLTVHSDKAVESSEEVQDRGALPRSRVSDEPKAEEVKPVYPRSDAPGNYVPSTFNADNPYENLKTGAPKLDQDGTFTAESRINELTTQIQDQEKVVQALSLIIELLESNPLIINKYVIAKAETLEELITLLTGADSVEILTSDIECGCNPSKAVAPVERIYVTKGGDIKQLKYDFPEALRMLETHRISTKLTY